MKPVTSTLYMIASPLGHRDDITLRAIQLLSALRCFFVEDTREFRKLMNILGMGDREYHLFSYAKHNMKESSSRAIGFLEKGISVGFLSDRGTPGISDPGSLLVSEAIDRGYFVVPVPGPSAVSAAFSVCGFDSDRFVFLGFLPEKQGDRSDLLNKVQKMEMSFCFFESAVRMRRTLEELKSHFPSGSVFTAREMTKMFESYSRFSLAELSVADVIEKGEYTVIVKPGVIECAESDWQKEIEIRLGPDKHWAKQVAERFHIPAKQVYNALQKKKTGHTKN